MIAKRKVVRLTGRKLAELNEAIHSRDEDRCVLCHRWVDPGEKFHHIDFKSHGGGDEIDNGATLCHDCHLPKAHGPEAAAIRKRLKEYIQERKRKNAN